MHKPLCRKLQRQQQQQHQQRGEASLIMRTGL
jgi:hypothetical protein